MKVNSQYKIRCADINDKDSILNLLNEVFRTQQRNKQERSNKYFDWKFLGSPFANSILSVAEYGDQIIGFDHLWPWRLTYKGESNLAYQGCDSVVKTEFRGNRILQQLRSFGIDQLNNQRAALLFNFPNNQSIKTNLNYGYSYLGKLKWWVKITDPIKMIGLITGKSLSSSITLPDDTNMITDCDLISKIHQNYAISDQIFIDRTPEFINYRYRKHPNRKYFLEKIGSDICAIYTINNNNGYGEMVVTDLIGEKKLVSDLLSRLNKIARELHCAYLTIIGDNYLLDDSLILKGFIPKKLKNLVVFPMDGRMADAFNYSTWVLSASLHDSI